MLDHDIVFRHEGQMYVADFLGKNAVISMKVYTLVEVQHAKQAFEFIGNAGFRSHHKVVHMLQDGNISKICHC
jgi:hypothetical protein